MVYLCASIAAASPFVTAEVFDIGAFPDLAARYKVGGVPKVLIDDAAEVAGVVTAAALIEKIAAAAAAGAGDAVPEPRSDQ